MYTMPRVLLNVLTLLNTIFTFINVAIQEKTVDYIYYSPWWIKSRAKFGFPAHFQYLRIYYFDEWDDFKSLWWKAWDLVEGANYEVPKYLREKNYIPTNWKYAYIEYLI